MSTNPLTQASIHAEAGENRWSYLRATWDGRCYQAAQLLAGQASVVDIGCGLMTLRDHLADHVLYHPIDIVDRGGNLVADLNSEPLPAIEADSAAMLGVIEYIEDVDGLLMQLRAFSIVVISYNYRSRKDLLRILAGRPVRHPGWRHHMSRNEFEQRLLANGFRIDVRRRVRWGEALYRIVPETPRL